MASGTVPRGLHVLAVQATYDLQSAYIFCFIIRKLRLAYVLCFIIRKLRFALVVYSGFTRDEYLIALVDFIVALRRTKGRRRRTLRSPSPPSSGLHLLTHWGIRCGGAFLLPRAYRDLVSLYPVQVDNPKFRILCSYLCSVLYRSRFSWVVGLWSFVFHYWGDRSFVPAATLGFAFSFVGFALTANGVFLWAGNGMGNLCC